MRSQAKLILAMVAISLAGLLTALAADVDPWLTDFDAAKKAAKTRAVPILADFSGSDWCGWCIKLEKEVFSKEAFLSFAKEHVVLFLADFPNRTPQPAALKTQNKALAETYGIEGFPTVLLLDADGKELARTGYEPGGVEPYVKNLKALLEKHAVSSKTEKETGK